MKTLLAFALLASLATGADQPRPQIDDFSWEGGSDKPKFDGWSDWGYDSGSFDDEPSHTESERSLNPKR